MNKTELIAEVAKNAGVSKKEAGAIVNAFTDTIEKALKRDAKMQISGFGAFTVCERAPRIRKNPKTGEVLHLPRGKAPVFKPSERLKETIQYHGSKEIGRNRK